MINPADLDLTALADEELEAIVCAVKLEQLRRVGRVENTQISPQSVATKHVRENFEQDAYPSIKIGDEIISSPFQPEPRRQSVKPEPIDMEKLIPKFVGLWD